jgi:hypothetical protein
MVLGITPRRVAGFVVAGGAVYAISGATRSTLYELDGPAAFDQLGFSVAALGDVDDDGVGVPDVAVGDGESNLGGNWGGAVSLFSGATGNLIYEIASPVAVAYFAIVTFTEDVDADGTPDLFIGAPSGATSSPWFMGASVRSDRGTVVLMSGRDGGSSTTSRSRRGRGARSAT